MAISQLQEFTNNATTTVPASTTSGALSVTVATGTGSLFPTLTGSEYFIATMVNITPGDPGLGQMEIVKVTARTGDVMTILRAQEGSSATSFPTNSLFELRPTAGAFNTLYTNLLQVQTDKADLASPVFTGNPTAPTPAVDDNDTSLATTAYVTTQDLRYATRSPNLIINPHGSIQQETTAPVTTGSYFADQWTTPLAGTGFSFQTGVTTGTVSNYDPSYMFAKTTSAKGSLAAGDFLAIQQNIEGNFSRRLLFGGSSARGSWLRWRASASQSGTASVYLHNGDDTRSFVQTFAVTTTPTDYTLFVPGDTSGTWVTTTARGASVGFCFAAGTTFQTSTLGAWQAGNLAAANTQSNMLDTVNRQLNVTDVQWIDSTVLLPFIPIDYSAELARCKRYWQSFIAAGVDGYANGGQSAGGLIYYPVELRSTPSISQTGSVVVAANTAATTFSVNTSTLGGTKQLQLEVSATATGRVVLYRPIQINARM